MRLPPVLAVLPLLFVSTSALADPTKGECVQAADRAQALERQSKFIEARQNLRACAVAACPGVVMRQCTSWLERADEAQPSIAFAAKDGAGDDVSNVQVTLDGRPFTRKLDGTPIEVDPGEHTFEFTVQGTPPVTRKVVIVQGEKGRRVGVVVSAGPPTGASVGASSVSPGGLGTRRIVGLTAAGVGVVGIAVGGAFGALFLSSKSQLESDCPASGCTSIQQHGNATSAHSSAVTDGAVSTVGFIAGGILLAGGATLFLLPTATSDPPGTGATRAVLAPSVGVGSAGLSLRGTF